MSINRINWDEYDEFTGQQEQEDNAKRMAAGINGISASDIAIDEYSKAPAGMFYSDWLARQPKLASDIQIGGDHYRDMPIQPSEFNFENGLNWLEGNAIKYICRHHAKGGEQDIDKAIHYLELLKEWQYGEA